MVYDCCILAFEGRGTSWRLSFGWEGPDFQSTAPITIVSSLSSFRKPLCLVQAPHSICQGNSHFTTDFRDCALPNLIWVSGLAVPCHCPLLPLLQLLLVPCPSLARTQHSVKCLCCVQCVLLNQAHAASFSQACREVATLGRPNLLLKPALPFLTAVHTARGTSVSLVGIHLAFAALFL